MRRLAPVVLALALAAAPAAAQSHGVTYRSDDSVVRVMPRYPMRGADALVSRDGLTALVLTDRTLILQLTNEGIDYVTRRAGEAGQDARRDLRREGRSEPVAGALAALVNGLVGGVLRSVVDRGLEYDLRDLADARWVDGRFVVRRASGEEAFGDVEVQGRRVMESFDAREARAFAERVRATARRVR